MKKLASFLLAAGIGFAAFGQSLNVKRFDVTTDIQNNSEHSRLEWDQGESPQYRIRVTYDRDPVSLPSNSTRVIWKVWDADDTSTLFVNATGTVENATNGTVLIQLTSAEANLTNDTYKSVVQLWDTSGTTNYMGLAAKSDIKVNWSPANAGLSVVGGTAQFVGDTFSTNLLENLANVSSVATPTTDHVLTWNGASWSNKAAGAGSGDLTAVEVTGGLLTVASGTGPIPSIGLTSNAVGGVLPADADTQLSSNQVAALLPDHSSFVTATNPGGYATAADIATHATDASNQFVEVAGDSMTGVLSVDAGFYGLTVKQDSITSTNQITALGLRVYSLGDEATWGYNGTTDQWDPSGGDLGNIGDVAATTFTGDGSALTALDAADISAGSVASAIDVSSPTNWGGFGATFSNAVAATESASAGGGGAYTVENDAISRSEWSNVATGSTSVIMGGTNNTMTGAAAWQSIIGAGTGNRNEYFRNFIGAGSVNVIWSGASDAAIGGGKGNDILAGGDQGFIGAGENNEVADENSCIVGGAENKNAGDWDFNGGGRRNHILSVGDYNVLVGGLDHRIFATGGANNTIGGGNKNLIYNGPYSTIPGGSFNIVTNAGSTVIGNNGLTYEDQSLTIAHDAIWVTTSTTTNQGWTGSTGNSFTNLVVVNGLIVDVQN